MPPFFTEPRDDFGVQRQKKHQVKSEDTQSVGQRFGYRDERDEQFVPGKGLIRVDDQQQTVAQDQEKACPKGKCMGVEKQACSFSLKSKHALENSRCHANKQELIGCKS